MPVHVILEGLEELAVLVADYSESHETGNVGRHDSGIRDEAADRKHKVSDNDPCLAMVIALEALQRHAHCFRVLRLVMFKIIRQIEEGAGRILGIDAPLHIGAELVAVSLRFLYGIKFIRLKIRAVNADTLLNRIRPSVVKAVIDLVPVIIFGQISEIQAENIAVQDCPDIELDPLLRRIVLHHHIQHLIALIRQLDEIHGSTHQSDDAAC